MSIEEGVSVPRVYNKYKDKNIPINAVYIGRPTKWGNPFRIGDSYQGRVLTREDAVAAHRDWFLYSDEGINLWRDHIWELRGKDLICFCAPMPCHGDVLLELANA